MALGNLAHIGGCCAVFFIGRLAGLPPSSRPFASLPFWRPGLMILQTVRHPPDGILLPLEILSAMGNILSHAWITAIGMASVVLSLLASMLGGMMANVVLCRPVVVLVNA